MTITIDDLHTIQLALRRLHPTVTAPTYQTSHAAGLDLHAAIDASITLTPGMIELVPTGFSMMIPVGFEGQVRPRSGLAVKHGISIPNAPGTIDADYRGQVLVPLINLGRDAFIIEPDMRIAQLIIAPVARAHVQLVDDLPDTDRGAGGFGSTGR